MPPIAIAIIQLVAQYGIPLAQRMVSIIRGNVEANNGPTPELWVELAKAENDSEAKFVSALGHA